VVLWVRSCWRQDVFWSYHVGTYISGRGTGEYGKYDDNTYLLEIGRGAFAVGYLNHRYLLIPTLRTQLLAGQGLHHATSKPHALYGEINIPQFQRIGFKYGLHVMKAGGFTFGRQCIVPLWFLAAAFAVLPTRAVAIRFLSVRRRRMDAGLCPTCSYNLTDNTSGVCPECGLPVVPAHKIPGLPTKTGKPCDS
jgi:hypothetical protein